MERGGAIIASRIARVLALLVAAMLAVAPAARAHHQSVYIVTDAETGQILQGARFDQRVHPASLTKMMTLYLVFEALEQRKLRLDQPLRASRAAVAQPASKFGLRLGERITVRDAVRATAVSSANDASVVLAEAVSGSEAAFARAMTRKARFLGMRGTTFRNAHGLTQRGHLSTAEDMAILSRRLWLDFPRYYNLFGRTRVRVKGRTKRATNTLLGVSPGVDGIKTGFTRAAGHSLAASAERGGRRVIVVFMGGKSRPHRDRTVRALLDRGFRLIGRHRAPIYARPPRPRPGFRPDALVGVAALPSQPAPTPPASTQPASTQPAQTVAAAPAPTVAAAPAAPAALRGAPVTKRPAGAKLETAGPAPAAGWAVQVGAFRAERAADNHLRRLLALDAPGLSSGYRTVVAKRATVELGAPAKPSTVYRARFTGLDEKAARTACRFLKKRRYACALVPPGGWVPANEKTAGAPVTRG